MRNTKSIWIRLIITLHIITSFYYGLYGSVQIQIYPGSDLGRGEDSAFSPSLPSLSQLSQSNSDIECPFNTAPIPDVIVHNENSSRKIPRIIHFTSKTRCATSEIILHVNNWRLKFPNYSIYFHDDEAVKRLTSHPISQRLFPLLNETLKCVTNGATLSDVWRYLILYLYGGIYSDIDNTPMKFSDDTIRDEDDFFSIIEGLGIMAQYFIASSPSHPLMKLSLDAAIKRLRSLGNVMKNNAAKTTGPGAFKIGFMNFTNNTSNGYIVEGKFDGVGGRTVTVVGNKARSREYINRDGLPRPIKIKYYEAIGTEHFSRSKSLPNQGSISCMEHLRRTMGTQKIASYTFDGHKYVDGES